MKNLLASATEPQIKKYDFTNLAEKNNPNPDHMILSNEDFEAVKKSAYEEGYKHAMQQLTNEQLKLDRMIVNTVEIMQNQFSSLIEAQNKFEHELTHFFTQISCQIAKKIANEALKNDPLPLINNFALEALKLLSKEKEIIILVHSRLKPRLAEHLEQLIQKINFEGVVNIKTDDSLAEYDCQVLWKNGHIENNRQRICDLIEQFVKKE